ncbi:MAG: hypothetical protein A3F68_06325 [Acidobacteria bacterium RIFCSPLOWO2_12_FULL_54_10]|nr:MAG: hypothetical protein A3F68_06325 [Acidobacteria bacterium RIFCSPLOWO2_12_FULL_54_10]
MLQISAVIITHNEEKRIGMALETRSIADEILVVDSGSTDGTRGIVERYGARFIHHDWQGYAKQKNFAASQAKYDWILSLDADEALSPELASEIQQIKINGTGDAVGFLMPRLARYQGRWIRHSGWYPDCKLRLYDRRRGSWTGNYVHEQVTVDGPVQMLKGDLLHITCDSLEEHLRTLDRYTSLAAQESCDSGKRSVLPMLLAGPPWKFFETYILRRGFADGFPGFVISVMAGVYVFVKYTKLWELVHGKKHNKT